MAEAVIEPVTPEDHAGVAELYRRGGYGPGAHAPRMDGPGFARVLEERGTELFLVARQDGRTVGTCGFFRMSGQRVAAAHELFAGLFFVDPRYRGGSLAGRLFSIAIARLIEAGVESLRVEVDPSNQQALPLYRRVGFRSLGRARTDEEGYVELVNHLPGLLAELSRRFPEQAEERIDTGAGWRGMDGSAADTGAPSDIETVQGVEVVRYEFRFEDVHIRALMDPDSGELMDLAVSDPGELPEPDLCRPVAVTPGGDPETVSLGALSLQLDPLNGVLSLYHRDHLGPLVVDPWPAWGPPYLTGWRRQPDRDLAVSPRAHGWAVRETVGDAVLCRASELTSTGVEHTVWWEGDPAGSVLAAPWCALRQALLWVGGAGYRPTAMGRYPAYLMDFEGLAQDTPEPADPSSANRPDPSLTNRPDPSAPNRPAPSPAHRPVWWDPASRLALEPHSDGADRVRYTMGYLPALEWKGRVPLTYGTRVRLTSDPYPDRVPAEAADAERIDCDTAPRAPSLAPVPAAQLRVREHTLARAEVTTLVHGDQEYILSPTAGGLAAWRSSGSDVLATPFPRTRSFGANSRWRTGLWACRQPGREDPEFGLGWGHEGDLPWERAKGTGTPGAGILGGGLELRVRPALDTGTGGTWTLVQVSERTSVPGPGEDLVVHLTPHTPRGSDVLVPGLPGHVWRLGTASSWRSWAGRVAVPLTGGRWLVVLPERARHGEALVRATSGGVLLSLAARRPASGTPTTWSLGVVADRETAASYLIAPETPVGAPGIHGTAARATRHRGEHPSLTTPVT